MPSTLVEQAAPYKIKLLENNLGEGELENKAQGLALTDNFLCLRACAQTTQKHRGVPSRVTTAHVIRCAFLHPSTRAPVLERAGVLERGERPPPF